MLRKDVLLLSCGEGLGEDEACVAIGMWGEGVTPGGHPV